jgi:diacylglycerol kinase (ATP)
MRAAAILGLGSSPRDLEPFQTDLTITWTLGLPAAGAADVVLIFGGDGTVHRHLGPLVKLCLPVLVVPGGSGNDFARALRIRGLHDALSAWHEFVSGAASPRAIDLGVITSLPVAADAAEAAAESGVQRTVKESYFCSVAGVGLDGAVAERANRLPRWLRGHGGYALSLPAALAGFAPPHLTVSEMDENRSDQAVERFSAPALLAAFANAPAYGGGMRIAPRAAIDDGKLDICIVGKLGKLKLLSLFPTVYLGRHLQIKQVKYFQAKSLCVQTGDAMRVYADGEYVCSTPIQVRAAAGVFRVIVPRVR